MHMLQSRRRFLTTASLAGAAGILAAPRSLRAEPPPETTTIRLPKIPGICVAPAYVADELLRAEGFTDVRYVPTDAANVAGVIAGGEVDFGLIFAAALVVAIDTGQPITALAGVHPGCFELFARDDINSVTDLRGRSVGVQAWGASPHLFVTSMVTYVGLDPLSDIDWVTTKPAKPMELFAAGKIDAFLGFPPEPQELRGRNIGHVIVNSTLDRPWSQYFCCLLAGNTGFVRDNPIATKRVLRAILKAADLCVSDPARAARRMVDDGFTENYDYALQALSEVPYGKWGDYDPEDTLRFYALRLREAGMVKSSPNDIIAAGADWRFLDELELELKG
jgi:NitT/TauT family transport system substrate-binding protein